MKKLSLMFAAAALIGSTAARAAQPAYTANPDVLWRGNFEDGATSLSGHCAQGQDGFCREQSVRSEQIQVVQDPVNEGRYAARFEVKYGDVMSGYSDERALLSPPETLWEDEGSDRWYRWQMMWPENYVGSYPKWDELGTPSSRSPAGWVVEWHHDANGGVETGSAPLYFGANDTNIKMCLVDQATSACRENLDLAPLQRGHWHDVVMHAKWSSDPSVGFLEIWVDGKNVLPKHMTANKYPGMRNYMLAGLYRNGHIGDPDLLNPDGSHVYGTDGAPGVVYLDGFIVGRTKESVLDSQTPASAAAPAPQSAPPATGGNSTPANGGTGSVAPSQSGAAGAQAGFPQGGGCSSGGLQSIWLALPLFGLFALNRRRRTANA
ncbi:MAG: polysaccharide lyase [Myxococcales bacterium]